MGTGTSTNGTIRSANSTSLLSNDSGFFLSQASGGVARIGTSNGTTLTNGMAFDGTNFLVKTPYFAIDSTGKISSTGGSVGGWSFNGTYLWSSPSGAVTDPTTITFGGGIAGVSLKSDGQVVSNQFWVDNTGVAHYSGQIPANQITSGTYAGGGTFTDKILVEKVASIEILIAGNYMSKQDFDKIAAAIFAKLDKIEDKLDKKVDK